MRGLLNPTYYTDREVFEAETRLLFGSLWIFAGLAQLVDRPGQFFTRRIGGREVVVQNIDGELRAFENICAHRRKLIHPERFGTGPLVCRYHGWRYAKDGLVANIPMESECYRIAPEERRSLGLRRFALKAVGSFIFVNVADEPLPIAEQFSSDVLSSLEALSAAFDDEVLVARYSGRFNWKLAYENLRDGLHPRFVHTQSLSREVRFQAPVCEELQSRDARAEPVQLARLSFGGPEGEFLSPKRLPFHDAVVRWGVTDAYFNWLLYPNTHVVCPDGGFSFSIEHHTPIAPDLTEVNLFFLTARKLKPYAGSAAVLWEYAKGAKAILDEDSAVMEEAQMGLSSAREPVTQGDYELQNRLTDRWYLNLLSGVSQGYLSGARS